MLFIMLFLSESDEGPTLETFDFTIRIGSTNLYSAYAAHYVYNKKLVTQKVSNFYFIFI